MSKFLHLLKEKKFEVSIMIVKFFFCRVTKTLLKSKKMDIFCLWSLRVFVPKEILFFYRKLDLKPACHSIFVFSSKHKLIFTSQLELTVSAFLSIFFECFWVLDVFQFFFPECCNLDFIWRPSAWRSAVRFLKQVPKEQNK